MRRVLFVLATITTFAVPVTIAAFSGATAASAASSLTCSKMKGTAAGTVSISKCSVVKADKKTFKDLNGSSVQLATGGTLTWASSGETVTISAPVLTTPPTGTCPAKDVGAFIATGTVTGGTSTITQAGDTFSATVCEAKNGKVSLAKGTVADF